MSDPDFLADYVGLDEFAKRVDRHPRSVWRWTRKPNGLPFVKLGNRFLIHVPTARAWLQARIRQPNRRRTKRKHAA